MASSWTHVTALLRSPDLAEGLAARVADPLWMLARQRQFGALKGEDAGSPVQMQLKWGHVPVDHLTDKQGTTRRLTNSAAPIEPFVEADNVEGLPSSPKVSVEAALDLMSRLPSDLAKRLSPALRAEFPISAEGGGRMLKVLCAKGFDGHTVLAQNPRKIIDLAKGTGLKAADQKAFSEALTAWRKAQESRFAKPIGGSNQWNKQRLEYEFALQAKGVSAQLDFDSYDGSRFDWYQAQFSSSAGKAFSSTPNVSTANPLLTRISYAGMPSRRFWSFEDGEVFFGNLEAGEADLPQLLLAEFATVYSDDWYYAPITVPSGSMARIISAKVVDTFGETREIRPAAAEDGADRAWRFFELTGDKSAEGKLGLSPWLYVPRVTDSALESDDLEQVSFMRDEAANLLWAIEAKIENANGRAVDRVAYWQKIREEMRKGAGQSKDKKEESEEHWRYLIENAIPPYWIPFVPTITPRTKQPTGLLERRRMTQWLEYAEEHRGAIGPRGLITAPTGPLSIHDEEVPRGGLIVSRQWQAARGVDGQLIIWPARRKRPAGQVETSGRQVDAILDETGVPIDDAMASAGKGGKR